MVPVARVAHHPMAAQVRAVCLLMAVLARANLLIR